MPRPLRIDFAGAWHHVMNRGQDHQDIFRSRPDGEKMLSLLVEATTQTDIEVHAFALMDNHYHFLMRSPAAHLSIAMQHVAGSYARYFNDKYNHDGSPFRGRFHSVLIDNESHFIELPRYIHNNPVKAGVVTSAANYRWSSHRALTGLAPVPDFLSTDVILPDYFSGSRSAFADFVEGEDSDRARAVAAALEGEAHYPRLSVALAAASTEIEALLDSSSLAQSIRDSICAEFDVKPHALTQRTSGSRSDARALALTLLYRHRVTSPHHLATLFNLSAASSVGSAVRRFEKRASTNSRLRILLDRGSLLGQDAA